MTSRKKSRTWVSSEESPKEVADELLVFGYSCKVFRDEEKAVYIDEGKHLIPWMGDKSLLIDRYDGRGYLPNLREYEPLEEKEAAAESLAEEDQHLEELLDEERYMALQKSLTEEELYHEEELKRLRAALIDDGAYNQVGFSYEEQQRLDAVNGQQVEEPKADSKEQCKDILRRNGSAMDAAISATFCLAVVDPHHTGLGGGFLMTYYDRSSGVAEALDARETAPSAATWDMFAGDPEAASKGGRSVAVPGLVKGLWTAHQMHGRLEWSALVTPSIALCLDGFVIRKSLADALQSEREDILKDPGLRSVFADASGKEVLTAGQLVKQRVLGDTLRLLAAKGGEEFYSGDMAETIARDVRAFGGVMEARDLRDYAVKIKEPVVKRTRTGQRVYSAPAPGSGALVAFFLNIMEGYELTNHSLDSCDEQSILTYHRMAEALKHVYARRTELADPDFEDVRELSANLTSKEYADQVRTLIRDDVTFPVEYYGAKSAVPPEDHGTSHVSVVGPDGDAVAITSTLNQRFGSRLMSASTGIILNDEMDDFSSPNVTNFFDVVPSPANRIVPGKRPLSSMCPTVVVDAQGRVTMVTGAAGGIRITSSTACVILDHLFFNESVVMATDSPRFHHQLVPDEIEVEYGLPGVILNGLRKIGHTVTLIDRSATAVNTISRDADGQLDAVGDHRVDARVDGF